MDLRDLSKDESGFDVREIGLGFNESFTVEEMSDKIDIESKAESDTPVTAVVDVRKFSEYIFKEDAVHGKGVIFTNLGYEKEDSEYLAQLYRDQAEDKYAGEKYTLGKKDAYGQRINIIIDLQGKGEHARETSHLKSGWMIDKTDSSKITLNTPFAGFGKEKDE